jgi:hypothetical protein
MSPRRTSDRCVATTAGRWRRQGAPDECVRKGRREFGEIDRLQAVATLLKRRVLGRQERPKNRYVVLRTDLIVHDAVIDRYEPAVLRPVRARCAEVGLWSRLRRSGHDSDRLDARIAEREHDVAGRNLSHVLVELVAGSIRVLLRRPHEAPSDFSPVRLILIDNSEPSFRSTAAAVRLKPDATTG